MALFHLDWIELINIVYIGRLVAGLGVGLMSSVCPTYSSEIAPKEIRGRVTGQFQIIVVTGVAISFWVSASISYIAEILMTQINYAVSLYNPSVGALQWRVPIGFQLVPVGLMMMLLPIIKESPVSHPVIRFVFVVDCRSLTEISVGWS